MKANTVLRTLIVDDSLVFRSYMRRCLEGVAHIEVVGTASDGRMALRQIAKLKPDLITLDMEMPLLNGIEVLKELQLQASDVKVIVVSGATEISAQRTLDALAAGACDFIIKPKAADVDSQEKLTARLGRCARVARSVNQVVRLSTNMKQKKPILKKPIPYNPDIIAIGSSTGGPAALGQVISNLPANLSVPIVITQHMPKLFVQSLAQRLHKDSALQCEVAEDGMILEAGHVYLAPGEIHMEVIKRGLSLMVRLVDGPKMHHCKPAVDPMFFSLAQLAPMVQTLAVVLTGMGKDGAAGALKIKAARGYVIAQDEATSSVWGMPGETVKGGAADCVLPVQEIAAQLHQITAKRGEHATA